MNPTTRITSVICLSMSLVVWAGVPAHAQFSTDEARCRASVAKAGSKLSRTILKSLASCHKKRNGDATLEDTDCNQVLTADLQDRVPAAISKFTSTVSTACPTQSPAALLYEECPSPCSGTVLTDFGDVAECLACAATHRIESFTELGFGYPSPPLDAATAACHRNITKSASKLMASILKAVTRCQAGQEKFGVTTTEVCTQTNYESLVEDAAAAATAALETPTCGNVLPSTPLDACGGADSVDELSFCVVGHGKEDTQTLVGYLLALPDTTPPTTSTSTTSTTTSTTNTTTTSTTTTLEPGDPACPGSADVEFFSRDTNQSCTTNTDCLVPRTCGTSGKCVAAGDLDIGWVGLGHDQDENSGDTLSLFLNCQGPADPGCGTCTVTGVDPAPGNCRCANDSRTICDDPFALSSPDCGGAACNCYLGAPMPISSGGTPLCAVQRLASDVGGTMDVDAGAAALSAEVRVAVHLGLATSRPCPTCGGVCSNDSAQECDRDDECPGGTCELDAVAGDGIRGGRCNDGYQVGATCDVAATNASFPAYPSSTGGSGYSLDCMPNNNISGQGLKVDLEPGTGASSLASNVSCGAFAPMLDCPCLLCSADTTVACNADSDCAGHQGKCSLATGINAARCDTNSDCSSVDAGNCNQTIQRCQSANSIECLTNADCDNQNLGACQPSTCSARGSGLDPLPNQCEDLACTDLGGGEGECTTGPDNKYCDGLVRADGSGILACYEDDACSPAAVGIDAGSCSLTERLECFLDPIAASGSPDPSYPVLASTYCSPPTTGAGVNSVLGLPGPVRSVRQTSLTSYCSSNPAVVYSPGVGGCP